MEEDRSTRTLWTGILEVTLQNWKQPDKDQENPKMLHHAGFGIDVKKQMRKSGYWIPAVDKPVKLKERIRKKLKCSKTESSCIRCATCRNRS